MMDKLSYIIAYILKNYPYKRDLCNARVTKIIYLADWKSALVYNKQISDIKWYFDNYGPFVHDVENNIEKNNSVFDEKKETNAYGMYKKVFSIKKDIAIDILTNEEMELINQIINLVKGLNWDNFIKLVYSTYPILTSERYTHLDLVEKAKEKIRVASKKG